MGSEAMKFGPYLTLALLGNRYLLLALNNWLNLWYRYSMQLGHMMDYSHMIKSAQSPSLHLGPVAILSHAPPVAEILGWQ